MTRADTAWLKGHLETIPALMGGPGGASKVFVTQAKYPSSTAKVTTPYVVIDPEEGTDEARRYTGPKNVRNPRFTIRIIGETADQVQFFFEKIKAVLVVDGFGVTPTISGERAEKLWFESPAEIGFDPDPSPPLAIGYIRTGWATQPA